MKIKILKNTPPPLVQRPKGEALRRLDERSRVILDALDSISPGDAIDLPGTVKEVARIVGAMIVRKYGANKPYKVKCVQLTDDKTRVHFI